MGPKNGECCVKYNQYVERHYIEKESYCFRELRRRGQTGKETKKKINN